MRGKGGHAWDTTRYRNMINEWAVHILLECILVAGNDDTLARHLSLKWCLETNFIGSFLKHDKGF